MGGRLFQPQVICTDSTHDVGPSDWGNTKRRDDFGTVTLLMFFLWTYFEACPKDGLSVLRSSV